MFIVVWLSRGNLLLLLPRRTSHRFVTRVMLCAGQGADGAAAASAEWRVVDRYAG